MVEGVGGVVGKGGGGVREGKVKKLGISSSILLQMFLLLWEVKEA